MPHPRRTYSSSPGSIISTQKISIVVCIIIVALVLDMELSNVSDIIKNQLITGWGITAFVAIILVYIIGQYFILDYVKRASIEIRSRDRCLLVSDKIVSYSQYVVLILLVYLMLQVVLDASYYVHFLTAILVLSRSLNIIVMVLLAQRFFSWYALKRDNQLLLYGVSSAMIAITAGTTIAFMGMATIEYNEPATIVEPESEIIFRSFESTSTLGILNYLYYYVAIVSFILMWSLTALLLRNYSQRFGRVKYSVLISAPIIFYMSQLFIVLLEVPFLGNDISSSESFIFYYSVIYTLSSTIGGILFGIPFWITARRISSTNTDNSDDNHAVGSSANSNSGNSSRGSSAGYKIGDYMNIAGFGLVLFFVSGSTTIHHTPYPPFGISSIAFMGISSYLILVGIYSCAVSASQDRQLRKSIRLIALEQSKLIDNIGFAQMQQQLEKRVEEIVEKSSNIMKEESGVEASMTEEEAKKHLELVLNEISQKRLMNESTE